jgi:hypothetical protein
MDHPDPGPYFDLRSHLEANPAYIPILRSRLQSAGRLEEVRDLDRLNENACQFFNQNAFSNDFFERIDGLLRLSCGAETDVYAVTLKTVADVMEHAVRDKHMGKPAGAASQPANATPRTSSTPGEAKPPLKQTAREVLAIITKQPEGKGIVGKAIIKALKEKGIDLQETSLRKHILPLLKDDHGVTNVRSAGGYLIRPPEADARSTP